MARLAALLRGINVGGRRIAMADLAEVFRSLGYDEVKTVQAAGNVLFDSTATPAGARSAIEAALSERFGYAASVYVAPLETLRAIAEASPFDADREGRHSYVVFFVGSPELGIVDDVATDPAEEEVAHGDGVLYWSVAKGSTLSSPVGAALGKAEGATTTTRNLRTLRTMLK